MSAVKRRHFRPRHAFTKTISTRKAGISAGTRGRVTWPVPQENKMPNPLHLNASYTYKIDYMSMIISIVGFQLMGALCHNLTMGVARGEGRLCPPIVD